MYRFVDQPQERLCDGSRFLLRSMRDWSLAANERRCPASRLVDCLGRLGSLEIQRDFHELMIDLHADPKLDLAFGAFDLPRISESEAIMLALWSDVVAERLDRVRAVLPLILAETLVGKTVARMVRIAAHMSTVGLAPFGLRRDPRIGRRSVDPA